MTANIDQIIRDVNRIRKANGRTWYEYATPCKTVRLRGIGTWIQRIETPNFTDSGAMGDISVSNFNKQLQWWLERA